MSHELPPTNGQRTEVVGLNDPLRRDFIAECCSHVARVADNAFHAICIGDDGLFEANIGVMRSAMRECMATYAEMKREAK